MRVFNSLLLSVSFSFLIVALSYGQQVKLIQGELSYAGKPLVNQPILVEGQTEKTWVDWVIRWRTSPKVRTITITDERGFFQLIDLPPGEYSLMWVQAGKEPTSLKTFKVEYGYDFKQLDVPQGSFGTRLLGINDHGNIVGMKAESHPNGFLYQSGKASIIPVPNSSFEQITGINNSGIIVGSHVDKVTKLSRAFIYDGQNITNIEPPGAKFTYAYGINDQGDVVGMYQDNRGSIHGFLYSENKFSYIDFPGVFDTRATGINGKRQIVGYYHQYKEKRFRGFIYENRTFTTVDYPGSDTFHTRLYGISSIGEIVGYLYRPQQGARGFLYRDGLFTDIQFPNASETFPSGINRHGAIVGYYNGQDGGHGFHAVPRTN